MSIHGAARTSAAVCSLLFAMLCGCTSELSSDDHRRPTRRGGESNVGSASRRDAATEHDSHGQGASDAAVEEVDSAAASDHDSSALDPSAHAPDMAAGLSAAEGTDAADAAPHDAHEHGDASPDASDASSAAEEPCDSTWRALQRTIFSAKRCAASACHGAETRAGGLELTPEVAYQI